MFWLQVIVALGIILATVLVAGGRGDSLGPLERDRRPQRLPIDRPVAPEDVVNLRLGVALRGYRMDEVDDALDQLAEELASRDSHIADLERVPAPAQTAPVEPLSLPTAERVTPADTPTTSLPTAPVFGRPDASTEPGSETERPFRA